MRNKICWQILFGWHHFESSKVVVGCNLNKPNDSFKEKVANWYTSNITNVIYDHILVLLIRSKKKRKVWWSHKKSVEWWPQARDDN